MFYKKKRKCKILTKKRVKKYNKTKQVKKIKNKRYNINRNSKRNVRKKYKTRKPKRIKSEKSLKLKKNYDGGALGRFIGRIFNRGSNRVLMRNRDNKLLNKINDAKSIHDKMSESSIAAGLQAATEFIENEHK